MPNMKTLSTPVSDQIDLRLDEQIMRQVLEFLRRLMGSKAWHCDAATQLRVDQNKGQFKEPNKELRTHFTEKKLQGCFINQRWRRCEVRDFARPRLEAFAAFPRR